MAKPYVHSENSVKRWGGKAEDYLKIHDKLDSSKAIHASMKHRAAFHHSAGIYWLEELFGHNIMNSDGKLVSVRDIAEQHIIEDLGFIPSFEDYLNEMEEQPWMSGSRKIQKRMIIVD